MAVATISAPLSRALGNSTGFQSFANSFGGAGSFGSQLVNKFAEGVINAGVNQAVHHNEHSIDWKMLSINAFGQAIGASIVAANLPQKSFEQDVKERKARFGYLSNGTAGNDNANTTPVVIEPQAVTVEPNVQVQASNENGVKAEQVIAAPAGSVSGGDVRSLDQAVVVTSKRLPKDEVVAIDEVEAINSAKQYDKLGAGSPVSYSDPSRTYYWEGGDNPNYANRVRVAGGYDFHYVNGVVNRPDGDPGGRFNPQPLDENTYLDLGALEGMKGRFKYLIDNGKLSPEVMGLSDFLYRRMTNGPQSVQMLDMGQVFQDFYALQAKLGAAMVVGSGALNWMVANGVRSGSAFIGSMFVGDAAYQAADNIEYVVSDGKSGKLGYDFEQAKLSVLLGTGAKYVGAPVASWIGGKVSNVMPAARYEGAQVGGIRAGIQSNYASLKPWEEFSPNVNWQHVFEGELRTTQSGSVRALGYHHESNFSPSTVRVIPGSQTSLDINGVYKAKVEIQDPTSGVWVEKKALSSFFPKSWSPEQVNAELMSAFENKIWLTESQTLGLPRSWEGIGDYGLRIQGHFHNGKINTFYPIWGNQ